MQKDIKALVQVGLMRKPNWLTGTLIERGPEKSTVLVSGNTVVVENYNVKEWKPLKFVDGVCKEIQDFQNSTWDEVKQVVKNALDNFFPDEVVRFDEDEKIIYIGTNDDLSIGSGVTERTSIVRISELPCWSLSFFKTFYSHMQPPDVDEINCGDSTTAIGIARILIETLSRFRIEEYFENVNLDRWAEIE